jgi:hypothetical protein
MSDFTEKAAAALELLPEELRQPAVAYLLEQAEKFRAVQQDLDRAIESVDAGQVREWDFANFLRRADLSR